MHDVEGDIERWLELNGIKKTLSNGTACIYGYEEAKQTVLASYFQAKAYSALVAFILQGYRDDNLIKRVTTSLQEDKDILLIKRLWNSLIIEEKLSYRRSLKVRNFFPGTDGDGNSYSAKDVEKRHLEETLPAHKQKLLGMLKEYIAILSQFEGATTEIERLQRDVSALETGVCTKLEKPRDRRKIDEATFWSLIAQSKEASESIAEHEHNLLQLLEQFPVREIVNFDKILNELMEAAYTWDLWALAYLAQDGCSDDAFEFFRGWLILQGKTVFQSILADVNSATSFVTPGTQTQAAQLMWLAGMAHERRAKSPLAGRRRSAQPAGIAWSEDTVGDRYPVLKAWFLR